MNERRASSPGRRASDPEAATGHERFRDYARAASDWFFELDAELRCVFVSERFAAVTGIPPEEVLGRTRREIAETRGELAGGEVEAERMRRHLEALERHEPYSDFRYAARLASGELRWWSVSGKPVRGDDGAFRGYRGVGRDVTEEVIADERLRESESRYRDLLDLVSDWVWETDVEGRFTLSSERIGQHLDIDERTWLGRTGPDILEEFAARFDGDDAMHERYVAALREQRAFGPVLYRCDALGDLPRYMEVSGRPRYDADGTFRGFRGTGTDVTERITAERALEALVAERTRELENAQRGLLRAERLAAIGQLTATVSHELRNPLGTIHATFHALRLSLGSLQPAIRERIERIERNIDRCVHIIEGLLDFTRTREPRLERVVVDDWLAAALDEIEADAGLDVARGFACPARAALDVERMRQALTNLVDNARQAMRDHASGPGHRVEVRSGCVDGEVRIEVLDSGVGIAPEHIEHVFEPLYSTRTFGIGLGLPLVHQIASEHGGEVRIESREGRGTRVTIALPEAS